MSKLRDGFVKAAGGYATKTIGAFVPGLDFGIAETFDCEDGGTVAFAPTGANGGAYTYNACQFDGATYNGTSQATFTLNAAHDLASYALAVAEVTATVDGVAVALNEEVECTVADDGLGSGRELPQHAAGLVTCVGRFSHNSYGADFQYAAGVADGTFQCECATNQWNMLLTALTATSGTADAAAGTGTAAIRRLDATRFEVTISVNGQSSTFTVGS